MKKLSAILLLSLLFFNWYGYRILSAYLQHQSDSKLEAKLDRNEYDESQLIELRVPINLPYHNDWAGFERFNGEIEIDGVYYKYVQRKVEKGELVLKCLPNNDKQLLQSARDNFFKLVNDLHQKKSSNKSEKSQANSFKGLFSDYQQEVNNWTLDHQLAPQLAHHTNPSCFFSFPFSYSPEQPPDFI